MPLLREEPTDHELFWPTVTAFGALWGTVEITLGSLLHTLRLPLTGALLASIGAAILVAQRQILPQRGASLATGIVACICKSVSPGGIIIGPMIGISVEALLVELALLAMPRNVVSAAFAGFLAASWTISQKVITQVVVYGADVVRLYVALFQETASSLGMPDGAGWTALTVVVAAVFSVGATLGVIGWSVGREARRRLDLGHESTLDLSSSGASAEPMLRKPMSLEPSRHRKIAAFFALACIALQFQGEVAWSAGATLLWLLLLSRFDPVALKRLWMPKFWIITALFGVGAGLFLGKRETWIWGIPFSSKGLEAGALMVIRGVFVFGLSSWASRALRREDLERFLGRAGGLPLAGAIATAFELLPALRDRLVLLGGGAKQKGLTRSLGALRGAGLALVLETAILARNMAARPPAGEQP